MQNRHHTMRPTLTQSLLRICLIAVVLLGSLLVFIPDAGAQDAAAPAAAGAESAAPVVTQHSLWDTFQEGGWVMYPLTICSIALVWLTVDLWMRTTIKKMAPPSSVAQTQDLFRAGDYVGAYQFCKNNEAPFTDITRVALSYSGEGQEATEAAIFTELNKVNAQIQTRINYLSVLGVCTPMIGLVGTVVGMMGAFAELGTSGVGDPAALAGHIGEVLIATASGLFIAVPAFMFFYFLRNRLQSSMHDLQDVITSLFRKMPYAHLKDAHVGEEEFFAAVPNWVAGGGDAAHGEAVPA
jgi:biopolymer transport protein ExbB